MSGGGQPARHGDVTVVIPCFNYGAYLVEAVGSALHQRGGPARVIVVDDGSTDPHTLEVLAGLPNEVEVVRRPNGGPSAARNTGAEHSDTPYLLSLDADDRLTPDALDRMRAPLDADPSIAYSYGHTELFGDWSGRLAFPDPDPYRMLYRSIVSATSLVRRSAWDAIGGFDPDIPRYEDWDFYLGALERGLTGVRVDGVTLLYRRHRGSKVDVDRSGYRAAYRAIRAKHARLYSRANELARESSLGPAERLLYRSYFAWRPIPARIEQAIYQRALFRRA